ncbi:hypothetical protein M0D21_01555 [Aquimarina sp. D1M17]|uniref:hypothetical protein n=1 Tax=Aquimarina acroporae TaxID=2937283 RepID=UPI0020C08FAA|nr:hypothetical protein [Aquimarina acroporae]MCK8520230.1 hypothetical protein [Aquimarina acroporae]
MSEIGEIIKEIAIQGDKTSTFPAIVSQNTPVEADGKKEYVISVRVLLSSNLYDDVINEISGKTTNKNNLGANGAKVELHNVRLRANVNGAEEGVIVIPRVGSWVLVSIIDNNDAKTYVSKFSEIDRVILRIRKPQDNNGQSGNQEPEYFEVDFNANTFDMKFGDLFETHINKEQLNIKFLQPKENDESSPQKILSEVNYVKDNLDITFLDDDEKPRATVHADHENLNVSFLENEEETLSTKLNKDKVTIEVTDGCTAVIEKDKASISTDGSADEISIDKNAGVTLKSGSNINIDATGSVNISGSSVNIN